jgi:aspartate racemase
VEGLIGFFVNTLVLRTELNGDPTFRELLRRVREVCLGAYAHQEVPFEKLVEQIQPERDMSHSPLFQVLFVLQNVPRRSMPEMPELRVGSIAADTGTSKFDLTLMMSDVRQELIGGIQYNTQLFNETTILRLIEHFRMLLEGIVSEPNRRLSTFPFMAGAQQDQLISQFNDDFEDLQTTSRGYASI